MYNMTEMSDFKVGVQHSAGRGLPCCRALHACLRSAAAGAPPRLVSHRHMMLSHMQLAHLPPCLQYLITNIPEIISMQLIYATDLQTRLAVGRLHSVLSATWGLLGGEGAFIPLLALYLYL